MDISQAASAYAAHGWALVEFPRATKGPVTHGWNLPQNQTTDPAEAGLFTGNIGLCHATSGTVAFDVDEASQAEPWLAARGISLGELLRDPGHVGISSGREGRAKLLYRLPAGVAPLPSKRPPGSGLELRCATAAGLTVQDVLPPSIHPVTQRPYTWEYGDDLTGHWSNLPELPPQLLDLWRSLMAQPQAQPQAPQGVAADRVRGMLSRLDPDLEYNEWIKVGMALHHEAEGEDWGLSLWDEWSAKGSKYTGSETLDPHWRSFGSNRGRAVTIQSVIGMAGGVNPDDFDDLSTIPAPVHKPKFEVIQVNAFAAGPQPEWIVKGVIPAATVGVMFAESGGGKSFAIFDIGMSVARGVPWNGQRVRQGRVVYVAAEGADGVRKRAQAYAQRTGVALSDVPLGVIAGRPDLIKDDHKALAAAVNAWGGADLLIIDTLAQSMAGGDENSGEDMGKVLAHCQLLHSLTNAMILLVHHSGKDASKGARGWSGLKAAMDCELEITRNGEQRALRVSKQKDGEDGIGWGFRLLQVALGQDADGDPVTSCVVEWGEMPAAGGALKEPKGRWQKAVWDVVLDNLELCDGEVPTRLVLDKAMQIVPRDPNGIDRRREYARRALEGLILDGWLVNEGENVAVKNSKLASGGAK